MFSNDSEQSPATPGATRPERQGQAQGQLYLHGAPHAIDRSAAEEVWESARCAQTDPEIFFPEQGEMPTEALKICRACPVMELCRATFGPVVMDGIVGGQTAIQRRRDRARRAGGFAA